MFFLRTLKVNLKRTLSSKWFIAGVLGSFVICMCAIAGEDAKTYDSILVFSLIGKKGIKEMGPEFGSYELFLKGISSWFSTYAPAVAAMAYVPVLLKEKNSHAGLFYVTRQKRKRYLIGNAVSAAICGGLALCLGYMMYGAVVFAAVPWQTPYTVFETKPLTTVLVCVLEVFAYGAYYSVMTLFISVFSSNIYIILCIPFFLDYGYRQVYLLAIEKMMNDGSANTNAGQWFVMNGIPGNILRFHENMKASLWMPPVLAGGCILFAALYIVLTERKADICD